jgi:hypothetical protein
VQLTGRGGVAHAHVVIEAQRTHGRPSCCATPAPHSRRRTSRSSFVTAPR